MAILLSEDLAKEFFTDPEFQHMFYRCEHVGADVSTGVHYNALTLTPLFVKFENREIQLAEEYSASLAVAVRLALTESCMIAELV